MWYNRKGDTMLYISLLSVFIIFLDQIIKIIVEHQLFLRQSIEFISGFFSVTYVQNYGAAFSVLTGNRIFLIVMALAALLMIYQCFINGKSLNKIEQITYGLLVGGIIGNLLDRMFRGYVVDYLDFQIFHYDFPVFNLADISIIVSALLILWMMVKGEKRCKK